MKSYGAILKEIINSFYDHKYPEYFADDVSEIIKREGLLKNGDYESEPVKHARWKGAGMGDYMCSRCAEVVSGNRYHYCPNCGAKMKEVKE